MRGSDAGVTLTSNPFLCLSFFMPKNVMVIDLSSLNLICLLKKPAFGAKSEGLHMTVKQSNAIHFCLNFSSDIFTLLPHSLSKLRIGEMGGIGVLPCGHFVPDLTNASIKCDISADLMS